MASTATAAVNSPSATPGPANNNAGGGRPQLKTTTSNHSNSGLSNSGNRRSVQSPVDGNSQQRRAPPHKAWSQVSQQKYQHKGPVLPSQMTKPKGPESATDDKHQHDRQLYLLINLTGRQVTVTLKTGARFSGILSGLSTTTPDIGCTLKWARQIRAATGSQDPEPNPDEYVGGGPEKIIIFQSQDLAEIFAEKVALGDSAGGSKALHNGAQASGFRTDTDISGGAGPSRERELQRWEPTAEEMASANMSLEDSTTTGGGWDQFADNEMRFGVRSDYDENIYTTRLDKNHPLYKQREAHAAKIAQEIEGQAAKSAHMAEERGASWVDDSGLDEEDKYSGVQRVPPAQPTQLSFPPSSQQGGPAKYTPPAKRAPSGNPTVPGAPHDPAIIASALARPESLQAKQQVPSSQASPSIPQQAKSPIPIPQVKLTTTEEAPKPREKPVLPDAVVKKVAAGNNAIPNSNKVAGAPHIEQQVFGNFKQFVHDERQKLEEKKREMMRKDKDVKLQDLMKFAREFKLHTPVPSDLIPILAKDKAKQAEIVEKARQNSQVPAKTTAGPSGVSSNSTSATSKATIATTAATSTTASGTQYDNKPLYKQPHNKNAAFLPHQSFARDKQIPQGRYNNNMPQHQQQPLGQRLIASRSAHQQGLPLNRAPMPIQENPGNMGMKNPFSGPKMNARATEFKPNPTASTFTPGFGGPPPSLPPPPPSAAPAVSPPVSVGYPPNTYRAASPSAFFGNKKPKSKEDRASVQDFFNPFKRFKQAAASGGQPTPSNHTVDGRKLIIDKPFTFLPTWPVRDENKDKKYEHMFKDAEFVSHPINSPQPPHMHPHQPHHPPMPPHMPHPGPPPHMAHPHQPHPHPQHLGIPPPHFQQDDPMRHISSPPSVMPSPHMANATVAFGSPSTHPAQLYAQHAPMQPYPGAPNGPQFGYGVHPKYFMQPGANGTPGNSVMVPGQPPMPYMPPFGMPIYSPQQMPAYPQSGPPPQAPPSTGYPSPRGAPMMMHQNSAQGHAAPPPQMMAMGMNPQMAGVYGAGAGQQQQMGNMMRGGYPPQHHYNNHQQMPHHYPPNGRHNGPYPGGQPHPGATPVAPHAQPAPHHGAPQPPPAIPPTHPEGGEESK